jgi:hypothetical protein
MTDPTQVDRLYQEATAVLELLGQSTEISLQNAASDQFRKALLLAAASYFEHRVCNCVIDFVRERASGSVLVENFVRVKAISRQYHTLFDWTAPNANRFFGLFGEAFKTAMGEEVRQSEEMKAAITAFLEVGNERNKLVHQDYASFPLEKTLDEIYDLYRRALTFVEKLPNAFRDRDHSLNLDISSEGDQRGFGASPLSTLAK